MTASKTIWVGSPVLSSCFFLSFSPEFRSLLFRWYKTFYSLPDCLASLDCLVGFYVHFIRCLSSSTGHHRFSVIFAHTHTTCAINSLSHARPEKNKTKINFSFPALAISNQILFFLLLFSFFHISFFSVVDCLTSPPKST